MEKAGFNHENAKKRKEKNKVKLPTMSKLNRNKTTNFNENE